MEKIDLLTKLLFFNKLFVMKNQNIKTDTIQRDLDASEVEVEHSDLKIILIEDLDTNLTENLSQQKNNQNE